MPPRQRTLKNLFLIFTVLTCCSTLQVSIPERQYEIARGGDITMTCSFVPARPELTFYVLTWEAAPDKAGDPMKPVVTEYMNQAIDIAPPYEGRATIKTDLNRRISTLTLSKVTSQDNRSYQCSVMIPNDDEGTTAATTSLLVLVAPSTPICDIEGVAEYFQDIKLNCKSEEGSPPPTYNWKSYSVKNQPRPFPPKAVQKDGVLSLFNITRDTSGYFTCTSTNRIASASCNFTLSVMPPTNKTAATIGIIAGVVAAVALLAVLGYCLYRKRSKKKAAEARAVNEIEFHDTDIPEAGEEYTDRKSNSDFKQPKTYQNNDIVPQNKHIVGEKFGRKNHSDDDDEGGDGKYGTASKDDPRDQYRGSRDRLDDQRDQYRGSRDRLDDQRDQYRGSRDRLDDQRDQYRGSRDRLDDQRDQYRGSRDRLDDQRDQYRGSRDRLDDQRDQYRGSRDRLNDHRETYSGRDRYDNVHDRYDRGSGQEGYNVHSSRDDYGGGGGGGYSSSSHTHSYDYD